MAALELKTVESCHSLTSFRPIYSGTSGALSSAGLCHELPLGLFL
jgi:hypothetical protein